MLVRVGSVADVPIGGLHAYTVNGKRVAVANTAGTLYAFDDTCTHQGCSLAVGHLAGTTVTCACHGSEFDVTTGEVLEGPAEYPVRSHAVEVAGGELSIEA